MSPDTFMIHPFCYVACLKSVCMLAVSIFVASSSLCCICKIFNSSLILNFIYAPVCIQHCIMHSGTMGAEIVKSDDQYAHSSLTPYKSIYIYLSTYKGIFMFNCSVSTVKS